MKSICFGNPSLRKRSFERILFVQKILLFYLSLFLVKFIILCKLLYQNRATIVLQFVFHRRGRVEVTTYNEAYEGIRENINESDSDLICDVDWAYCLRNGNESS